MLDTFSVQTACFAIFTTANLSYAISPVVHVQYKNQYWNKLLGWPQNDGQIVIFALYPGRLLVGQ